MLSDNLVLRVLLLGPVAAGHFGIHGYKSRSNREAYCQQSWDKDGQEGACACFDAKMMQAGFDTTKVTKVCEIGETKAVFCFDYTTGIKTQMPTSGWT